MLKEKLINLFIELVSYDTQSNPKSKTFPSTNSQLEFANILLNKCNDIGLDNVNIDKYGYVTAVLRSNTNKKVPTIGFISHMDTSPDCSGKNIRPMIIKDYNGKEIKLKNNVTISPEEFPKISNYKNQTLITSDGTTLLGADDKAGISEILTAMEYIISKPELKHGDIKIAFTPDEEIGKGVDYFNIEDFNCDFAYTIDGGDVGELNYENFNAARAKIEIHGKSVHPGHAKNTMLNSSEIALKLALMLPKNETPSTTSHYEGFYHLCSINGNVENTTMEYIIRDFDKDSFKKRKEFIKEIVNNINKEYKREFIEIEIYDEYYNMYEILSKNKNIVDIAYNAMIKSNISPLILPIRGGTDGARLSFMGLPCPNIFTGGHNFHGPYEYICVESMEKTVKVIINICNLVHEL